MRLTRDQRAAEYRGWLLCAASVRTAGQELQTPIACRRRPNRRPCRGRMLVMLTEVPERVTWRCSRCGDSGVIHSWRDNLWSLRECMGGAIGDGVRRCVVSAQDYALLHESIGGPALAVAAAQPWSDDGVVLRGDDEAFEDLLSAIVEVPEDSVSPRKRRELDRVRAEVERAWRQHGTGRGHGVER